ncbi:hypothetical protein RvY_01261 [Ramazzottius varieornatus]|uniref:Serine/threonine-protein phosphatase n=1 Tax=Ramazzottius varieornatus TaxID=947166 RepID=A0A1D1UR03_RAMVA|nr:hypothetical protein RvY_01261 [Ramazzottius varieornatus]
MGLKKLKLVSLLDNLIQRLWQCRNDDHVVRITNFTYQEAQILCNAAIGVLKSQPMLLRLKAPVVIAGDVHGQFNDVLRMFEENGRPEKGQRYLFLGDYVDRGPQSVECMCLLLAYKIKYPHDFYLIRGNHEERQLNSLYGFLEECQAHHSLKLWDMLNRVFDYLPMGGVVSNKVFCAHGGIGPNLDNLSQIDAIRRPNKGTAGKGVACDLMWADPDPNTSVWRRNEARNVSYMYGKNQVHDFLLKNNLKFICRAHEQPDSEGYAYPFYPDTTVLTIFSAPGYENSGSDGAVVHLDAECVPTIKTLQYIKTQSREAPHKGNQPRSSASRKRELEVDHDHES